MRRGHSLVLPSQQRPQVRSRVRCLVTSVASSCVLRMSFPGTSRLYHSTLGTVKRSPTSILADVGGAYCCGLATFTFASLTMMSCPCGLNPRGRSSPCLDNSRACYLAKRRISIYVYQVFKSSKQSESPGVSTVGRKKNAADQFLLLLTRNR